MYRKVPRDGGGEASGAVAQGKMIQEAENGQPNNSINKKN